MRVCFVSPLEGLHGGIRNIIQIINGLKERGHDAYLVTDKWPVDTIDPVNVPVVSEIGDCDVAIATWWPTAGIVMSSGAKKKGYFVQHDESIGLGDDLAEKARDTYKLRMDFHITLAPWLKSMLKDYEHYNVHVFVPPVNLNHFRPYGNKKKNMVLYFSRPYVRKNFKVGMEALEIIKHQRPDTEIVTFDTDPLNAAYSFVDRHILSPRNEDLGKLYSEATVYMQATPIEGFGTLSLEALACGTVVVTPDRGGTAVFGEGINYVGAHALEIADTCILLMDDWEIRVKQEVAGPLIARKFKWKDEIDMVEQFLLKQL